MCGTTSSWIADIDGNSLTDYQITELYSIMTYELSDYRWRCTWH